MAKLPLTTKYALSRAVANVLSNTYSIYITT